MLYLQETKLETMDVKLVRNVWGMESFSWVFSSSIGASGGLLTVWDEDFFCS
ncbi:hypothetical protein REPUB_Repub06bG0068100 [Reevesia pubescens]